jgi:hypothetical protein
MFNGHFGIIIAIAPASSISFTVCGSWIFIIDSSRSIRVKVGSLLSHCNIPILDDFSSQASFRL